MLRPAILAVFLALGVSGGGWAAPDGASESAGAEPGVHRLDEPLRVRFRLRDGVQVRGELAAWSRTGIDGSFGERRWTDLRADDTWRLYRRLMRTEDAQSWLDLGRTMLEIALDQPRAASHAESALRNAARLDPGLAPTIAATRDEVQRMRHERDSATRAAEAARLRTMTPEAIPWPAEPWRALDAEAQAAATAAVRDEAAATLARTGMSLEPIETAHFLVFTDLDRDEAKHWATELEHAYGLLAGMFDLSPEDNVFWGRAVVLVFSDRDRFRMVEAEAFDQVVPGGTTAICHPVEARTFIAAHRSGDTLAFHAGLVRETTHAFMHRLVAPKRLAPWANEGFANAMVYRALPGTDVDRDRRRRGLAFVRDGGNVDVVLGMGWDADTWIDADALGPSVGTLLVELMLRENPAGFARWVRAIKNGEKWEPALVQHYGTTRAALADLCSRYYMVND